MRPDRYHLWHDLTVVLHPDLIAQNDLHCAQPNDWAYESHAYGSNDNQQPI